MSALRFRAGLIIEMLILSCAVSIVCSVRTGKLIIVAALT